MHASLIRYDIDTLMGYHQTVIDREAEECPRLS